MRMLIDPFLRNRVAANLLAILLILFGALSIQLLNVRLFPRVELNAISITVAYPGATPNEVETGIVKPIEERLEGLEDVDKITALAASGVASVVVDLTDGVDVARMLNEVQTEIDRIRVFPEEAEEPQVVEAEAEELAAQIVLHGEVPLADLKALAERVRDDLAALPNASRTRIAGVPDYLIDISVEPDTLQALGLSLTDIARLIGEQSLDLSAGEIENDGQRILVRAIGERRTGEAFEDLVLRSGETGTPVRLGDIATVDDTLSEAPIQAIYRGEKAVLVSVYRVGDEKLLDVTRDVTGYLDTALPGILPAGTSAALWRDESTALRDRINLLARNAAIGLALVGLLLMAFLDLRIALWVAFGVGVSFLATFMAMAVFEVTINQLSVFGFILAIGIVVDDAIVVGENIHSTWRQSPADPMGAARTGVMRVATPVLFSVTTTIIAFVPLLFVPGTFGQFLTPIALVVIFVLSLSLVESFLVLPRHLSHLSDAPPGRFSLRRLTDPVRDFVAAGLRAFKDGPLRRSVTFCTRRPAMTVLAAFGLFLASLSLLSSGQVKFIFFPEVEGDYVTAELELAEGTSQVQTLRFAERIAAAAETAATKVSDDPGALSSVLWTLGVTVADEQPVAQVSGGAAANRAYVIARLKDASDRDFPAEAFETAWRAAIGDIPGAQTLSISSDLVGMGAPLQFQVSARTDAIAREAVAVLREELAARPGVFDVRDDRFRTADEVRIELTPLARTFGVSQAALASEVRAAFFGAEAVRLQRDREEIEVRVRLPHDARGSLETLERLRIRVGDGFVPIGALAELSVGPAPAMITRIDGRRVYQLSADIDTKIASPGSVTRHFTETLQPRLAERFDGLTIGLGGEQEEEARALPSIGRNFLLALLVIFSLLALNFRSYSQPLVVMVAIPFGFVGGLLGHGVLGLDLTLLSMFGIIGLSGVIINNALLVVDFINERLGDGEAPETAVIEAMLDRFRAILLTTLTTFLGVTPIIFETSVQAQFLVPTAVALGFGILFGTTILIFLLPALAALHLRVFGHPNVGAEAPVADMEKRAQLAG